MKKPEPWNDRAKHLADGMRKIRAGESLAPYELSAVVVDLIRRLDAIEQNLTGALL
jgi:hypothetical protein